jgi:hypothetical protein
MKSIIRTALLVTGAAFVATGCASGPQFKEMSSSIPTLSANSGRIYFFRADSFGGAMIQPEIKLNDQVVGRSTAGGFFFVDEPAGKYTVSTTTEVTKTVSFTLHTGETRYVRTSVEMGLLVGHVTPTLDDPETAPKEIEDLKYIGKQLNTDAQTGASDNGKL